MLLRPQLLPSAEANELLSKEYIDRITSSDGMFDPQAKKAVWFNKEVPLPNNTLAQLIAKEDSHVLGDSTEERWIEIDLSAQKLYAHEGNNIVYTFDTSSGLPWMPTPTGEFYLWAKVRSQLMSGGSIANGTYYYLPNVPYVQFFHGAYAIHGAYWHMDFGYPRSHGCVNLRVEDAKTLFYWTSPQLPDGKGAIYNIDQAESTRVVIHGTTPAIRG